MPPRVQSPARAAIAQFAAAASRGAATYFRCGGCGDSAVLTVRGPHYGQLVRGFLRGHEKCRSAVHITRSRTAASGAVAAGMAADGYRAAIAAH